MPVNQFLLYGANGYTGRLVAKLAHTYQLHPILAGRNGTATRQLADELGLPFKVFKLEDTVQLTAALSDVKLVLHAAGPFQLTAHPMIAACLATNTHYIDITGEIPVFEMAHGFDTAAKAASIMIMPGVGIDVVPTDCMALSLKKKMPDATTLELAFISIGGGLSHGTAATMVLGLGEGGLVRQGGKLVKKPLGHKGMWVDFGGVKKFVMTIPWGDISTAYFTTGIPNIETYTGIKPSIYRLLKLQGMFNWMLKTSFVRKYANKKLEQMPPGPTDEQRAKGSSLVWGRVTNKEGESMEGSMRVANGYELTAHSSLLIAQKILNGNFKIGYQTPAAVYGEDLVLEVPGSEWNPAT
jgi:short subunit dehydrogenase-like uncharacterized protein